MRTPRLLPLVALSALAVGCADNVPPVAAPVDAPSDAGPEAPATGDPATGDPATGDPATEDPATEDPATEDLESRVGDDTWMLVDGQVGDGVLAVPDDAHVTLRLDPDEGTLHGTAACNAYDAAYALDGGELVLEWLSSTGMGCDEPLLAVERRYLDAWHPSGTLAVELAEGDVLTLRGPDTRLVYERLAPAADRTMRGRWQLVAIQHGEGPDASVVRVTDRVALHVGEGTYTVTADCFTVEAEWVVAGAEVAVPAWSAEYADPDGVCLEDQPAQTAALDGLGRAFTTVVEGDELVVGQLGSETSLRFRAVDAG
ncbi:META domain-containing protein [Egicoccus halophilus]|uniref:DUF306 domain-containing protein n=1 Tax=Egicoccus halophilus TaxID=1670830 RepID=A0A8J3A7V7_9ACTN|nr:META domain-containing protein [Egicoccus halophilus]GGI06115.1 hypothetical protein GCM10011354_17490 [Egicoccus halophilus]